MYFFIITTLLFIAYFFAKQSNFMYIKLIFLNILATLCYTIYRFFTIPTSSLSSFTLGILLFLAEILGFFSFLNLEILFLCKKYKKNPAKFTNHYFPSVDVLICTYNEPINIVKKTILACKNLDYPKDLLHIYLCDDGNRKEMKELCDNVHINYLARTDSFGAKAGNINYALSQTSSDLFAVFDADMIPKKEFLTCTTGYFKNKKMAFVQTPQVYYNKDMYQHNLNYHIPNEQDFFMREIQTARDSINAVLHVGTNVVFQRKAVEGIGGYPTCSITEDMALGILLQNKGYQTKFLNKELVLGLSAATYRDLVKQRDRWCRGNLQVVKKYNPFKMKGLSFLQKLFYIDGTIYWLTSIQKIIFLICPFFYLLFNISAVNVYPQKLFSFFVPLLISQYLVFRQMISNTRTIKWSHYYETAMAPHIAFSIIKEIFCYKTPFLVTPKEIEEEKSYFQWEIVSFHLFLILVTILAWGISIYKLVQNQLLVSSFFINIFWTIYNVIALILCVRVAYHKAMQKDESIILEKEIFIKFPSSKNSNWLSAKLYRLSDSNMELAIKKTAFTKNQSLIGKIVELKINENIFCRMITKTKKQKDIITIQLSDLPTSKIENLLPMIDLYTQHLKPYYNPSIENY